MKEFACDLENCPVMTQSKTTAAIEQIDLKGRSAEDVVVYQPDIDTTTILKPPPHPPIFYRFKILPIK